MTRKTITIDYIEYLQLVEETKNLQKFLSELDKEISANSSLLFGKLTGNKDFMYRFVPAEDVKKYIK